MMHPMHHKLERALERMGGLYRLSDILELIATSKMQGFVEGESWVITRIADFPRAKVMEIVVAVGDIIELRILHDRVMQFAKDEDVKIVTAYGRKGWEPDALAHGWRVRAVNYVYEREP